MQKWGQHFLADPGVAKKIVEACQFQPNDEVLEIGPGHGELTRHYLGKVSRAILLEIDPRLSDSLKEKWGSRSDTQIINADFRHFDLNDLKLASPPVILSDLPYYASKPILAKILKLQKYKKAVLMIQKELAQRLFSQARDSDFSALSLFFQMEARGKILFDVGPECFKPRPKVTSSLIEIKPLNFTLPNKEALENLVKIAFRHRRKMLVNNLSALGRPKKDIKDFIEGAGISLNARPQEINLETYARLAQKLA